MRRVLTAAGLSEAVTFGFIEAAAARAFVPPSASASRWSRVANPLSAKFDTLRPSLLPGLVDAVAHNRRHGRRDVALFEIGARFTVDGRNARRRHGLDRARPSPEHWSAPPREVDFFDVKGVVEQLCDALGVDAARRAGAAPFLVAGQAAAVLAGDRRLGVDRSRRARRRRDAAARRAGQDLRRRAGSRSASPLSRARSDVLVRALPRHPSVVRDLSIVVV